MVSNPDSAYERSVASAIESRLKESARFIQVIAGARQIGKTTMVHQILSRHGGAQIVASGDEPASKDSSWLAAHWERARLLRAEHGGCVLVLDEIQKIPNWSETVKRLWDEDARADTTFHVVLLGSASLLVQQGLTESLAGRFEMTHVPHWSYTEMRDAFGIDLDTYLWFGAYPGAASLVADPQRWRRYLLDSLIETTISRDVLLMTRVDKPALLRRVFELACQYSGQVLSYTKMIGQLQDAGNATTVAHYLDLLSSAGMVAGLQKYSGGAVRRRGSIPKLQVLNTALMTAVTGLWPSEGPVDPDYRGRLVESAVGAHLANAVRAGTCELFYWRERNREVDFVLRSARRLVAIEVKSGRAPTAFPGLAAFTAEFSPTRSLIVGGDGTALEEFLATPVEYWLA